MRRTIKKWAIGFGLAYLVLLVPLPVDAPALFYLRLALLAAVTALLLIVASALLTEVRIQRLYAEPPDGAGPYATIRYGDIDVCFQWRLDGGGTVFSHEYVRLVAEKLGKVDHVFELCCGPGFIGFSLLAHGLCERLTLADVSRRALDAVRETIRRNGLEDRVTVHHSDALDGIPAGERWDLVVGNPPWLLAPPNARNLLLADPDGQVHKSFYRDVGRFLAPGGSVLLIEGGKYTEPGDFQPMLDQNHLQLIEAIRPAPWWGILRHLGGYPWLRLPFVLFLRLYLFEHKAYFMWVKRAAEGYPGAGDYTKERRTLLPNWDASTLVHKAKELQKPRDA